MTEPSPIADLPVDAPSLVPRPASYTRVAIALHWIIALCILGQIALGWRLHTVTGDARYAAFQLHKSIGISILLLSLARLAWRLLHPAPPEAPMPQWQHIVSIAVHWGLYAIMICLPLTGWLMVSTSRLEVPTRLFGIIPWPAVPGLSHLEPVAKAGWNDFGHAGHLTLVYVTIALLLLHFGAVLKHQLIDRDRVFARMAPGAQSGWKEPRLWVIAAIALVVIPIGASIVIAGLQHGHRVPAGHLPAATAPAAAAAVPVEVTPMPVPTESAATPARWIVQGGQLHFATIWGDTAIRGTFSHWTADIAFLSEDLERSSITVRIDLASVSTGDSQRDAALPTSDWFDTAAHPTATFRSQRIRATGGDSYLATGTLDLRGVRKSLALPFSVRIIGSSASAHGAFKIDRTAFGVGQGDWAATDQIPASVSVSFSLRANYSPRRGSLK